MTPNWLQPEREPTPEELAAFADGELEPAARERVESWLAEHPQQAAEVEADRHLMRFWHDNPPPEPSADAWDGALAHISSAVPAPAPVRRPWRPRTGSWGRVVGSFLAAAAVLSGVLLARPLWKTPTPGVPAVPGVTEEQEPEGPFPVATAEEVNIISMDAKDADAVVMGQPLMGSFELAAPEDIQVLKVEPHPADGLVPRLEENPVPMIVASAAEGWEP
jgi:anti-sigma factor RsiW